MSALVLDAGALIGVEEADRRTLALLTAARQAGIPLRSNGNVVAQVWRDSRGRQVLLSRFLRSVEVLPVTAAVGRVAGELLGAAGTSDVVDATVVAMSSAGDQILTSDRGDIERLVRVARRSIEIIDC